MLTPILRPRISAARNKGGRRRYYWRDREGFKRRLGWPVQINKGADVACGLWKQWEMYGPAWVYSLWGANQINLGGRSPLCHDRWQKYCQRSGIDATWLWRCDDVGGLPWPPEAYRGILGWDWSGNPLRKRHMPSLREEICPEGRQIWNDRARLVEEEWPSSRLLP